MTPDARARVAARPRPAVAGADDPVLISKITVPGVPAWAVRRPQIDELIAAGARGPLTTVTGPPGCRARQWLSPRGLAARSDPATLVWVTLDDYDNRPKVFWSYVVAAMRQAGIAVPRASAATGRGPADPHTFRAPASIRAGGTGAAGDSSPRRFPTGDRTGHAG